MEENKMAKFTDYTQKTKPADADLLLIHDNAGAANKKTPFSGVWSWILDKLASAVISQLETTNKSIIPAINELNSKTMTNLTKLLQNPTEYIKNISDTDYSLCLRNGKTVTLILNIKVLKQLSEYTSYLTLPEQYIPSSVIFAPTTNGSIRIGLQGEVMPCQQIEANSNIQVVISYVIK